MARCAQPADARLDLALVAVQHLEVRHLEDSRDDLRVRGLGLQPVHVDAPLRPGDEALRVIEMQVAQDYVLDVTRIHSQFLERPEHRSALHDQAGIDEVVALAPHEQRVRKRDHPRRAAARLQLLVAPEAVGRVVDRRYVRVTVGDSEDVPLRGYEDVDARHYSVAVGSGAAVVCDVYSNSSSAPNSRSSTAFRRSSFSAIARTAPTIPMTSSLRNGWRFLRLPWKRSEASFRFSAAVRRSRWTFLSSVSALTGPLPFDMRW